MKQLGTLIVLAFFCLELAAQFQIVNLRCAYKANPVGIDIQKPRFSWEMESTERNLMQKSYRIRVALNEKDLIGGKNLVWDSGIQESDQSNHLEYGGPDQISGTRYFWQIKVWDNKGRESPWSQVNYWETGLLNAADWKVDWVASMLPEDKKISQTAIHFRKDFAVSKKVAKARLYISSLGLYEAHINGKRVGDELFTPGWTSYNTRIQYQTYDVTNLVQAGDNAIGVLVGDGWYRGFIGWSSQRNFYGDQAGVIAQLEITYSNGKEEILGTDGSWKVNQGPILMSDIYNGEVYDARKNLGSWTMPGYDDSQWQQVRILDHSKAILIAPEGPPVRKIQEIKPVTVFTTPKGETVYDFGQNMVGWIRLKVNGQAGQQIHIQHAEVLDKYGNFYTENLRSAKASLSYTLKGGGDEIYEPHFTFMGFRYVKVEGIADPKPEHLTGIVIHSDMPVTGDFECSEPLLNQLQHNIQWGQKGNFLDVPTDCPQRDERMGWTGDAQAFFTTAAYNMDVASFFAKWLKDLEADQSENGMVPHVIPNVLGKNAGGSTGWADVSTIIPWDMYVAFGDKRVLEQQYNSMKAWVKYMEDRTNEKGLWNTGFHFGDWLFYSRNDDRDGMSAITDKYLIAQAFYANSADILVKTATVLGKTEDKKYYEALSKKVKDAFVKEYLTGNGRLVSNTQTAYVLALKFNLLPENLRQQATERLVTNIEMYNNHITTGFLGTPYICDVLTNTGHLDKAYTLLEQKTYPSWLYPVTMGATTIWERWDGIKPDSTFQSESMNSFNHYAYGAIGNWMYRVVAGINPDEAQPGYKHIIIAPQPGGTLTTASANFHSMYGQISSKWVLDGQKINLEIRIPPNTYATIYLPDAAGKVVMESGKTLTSSTEGVHSIREAEANLIAVVGSGQYSFSY